jgi:phage portal protein BeeE
LLPEELIDFHNFNPFDPYPNTSNGISPLEMSGAAVMNDRNLIDWNSSFFENG